MNLLPLMAMPDFTEPTIWVSLLTLLFLEIVLGVDNIIFISLVSGKLPVEERKKATNIGVMLAGGLRILMLFGISWVIAMKDPWFSINIPGVHGAFSGQSLILIAGGIFLLYKAVTEIHHKLEGQDEEEGSPKKSTFVDAIVQISVINVVFSFDSILTAVGMTSGLKGANGPEGELVIMIIAVILTVLILLLFANPVADFVNKHPTIQLLGLSFLILIGFMLITEGAHMSHLEVAGSEVAAIPKGYLYFTIAFSLLVEYLNMKFRKSKPVTLHGASEKLGDKKI